MGNVAYIDNNPTNSNEFVELEDKMKKAVISMSNNIKLNKEIAVDEVQFFEFKTYKNKNNEIKQGIKHYQSTGNYSMVYVGDVGKTEYNLKVMLVGETITYL